MKIIETNAFSKDPPNEKFLDLPPLRNPSAVAKVTDKAREQWTPLSDGQTHAMVCVLANLEFILISEPCIKHYDPPLRKAPRTGTADSLLRQSATSESRAPSSKSIPSASRAQGLGHRA